MSRSVKVTVLVPIYNVEKYLRQCLDSLTKQTLQEIEIICLNDGSTDGSLEIIKEYARKDDRVVVVDKKNSGYGDSMNRGLEKAHGKYVGIVESDDYIDLDAFEKLYNIAEIFEAEVVRANYFFNKGGKDKKNYYITPAEAGRIVDPARHTWIFYEAPAIWSAIYRNDFLKKHDIKFLPTPGASYQDTGFNFKVWVNAHRAYFTTEAFLHYRIDNEASSINSPGKVMNVSYEYDEIEKYLKEKGLFEEYGAMMEAAKFGSYYWNLCRLRPKYLRGFLKQVKAEYIKATDEGLVAKEHFESKPQWQMLRFIMKHSVSASVVYVMMKRAQTRLREMVKQLWIKTHPSYRKQKEISELITELNADIDLLEMKVKRLEEKREKA